MMNISKSTKRLTYSLKDSLLAQDNKVHTFEEVIGKERDLIESKKTARTRDGQGQVPLAIAFSGGGIRAAAFEAGVLWRLAHENKLKDVEYWSAASGGGYITTAFATHCLGMNAPDGGGVRDWYLRVVAKTVCRMQENAGDFVRDCFRDPGWRGVNAGSLPRIFDFPLTFMTLFIALITNPLAVFFFFLVPFTVYILILYGSAMRAIFCSPTDILALSNWWYILEEFSPFLHLLVYLALSIVGIVIASFVQTMPWCRRPPGVEDKDLRYKMPIAYFFARAASGMFKRLSWVMFIVIPFVVFVPLVERLTYTEGTERLQLCAVYIRSQRELFAAAQHEASCADSYEGRFWFNDGQFDFPKEWEEKVPVTRETTDPFLARALFSMSAKKIIGGLVVVSIVLVPVLGARPLTIILLSAGPIFVVSGFLAFVSYAIFGPITKNKHGSLLYTKESWDWIVFCCLGLASVLVPFYPGIRANMHRYYRRCLRKSFYYEGKERRMKELEYNAYCPFVLLSATSSDYHCVGLDDDNISEITFSPLHQGSDETGYFPIMPKMDLSKVSALSGAACLDTFALTMGGDAFIRFWMQLLNLSWGDFVFFPRLKRKWITDIMTCFGMSESATFWRLLHHLPTDVLWIMFYCWMMFCWWSVAESSDDQSCWRGNDYTSSGVAFIIGMCCLSFFSFIPGLDFLATSPLVRVIHQMSAYVYASRLPPTMMYVTDGGVSDNTTVGQLLMRKCPRILSVISSSDPIEDLLIIVRRAEYYRIASFFDPSDPRKSVHSVIDRWKKDESQEYLHIGVCYSWGHEVGKSVETGHLFVVPRRLPDRLKGNQWPVCPELTEEEIINRQPKQPREDVDADFGDMSMDDLGFFGCCDCCHTHGGNCGPKFPDGAASNLMVMSPKFFTGLVRLGFDISEKAVQEITNARLRAP